VNIKGVLKSVIKPIVKGFRSWEQRNPFQFSYQDITVNVMPGVYSPKTYNSTSLFLNYLSDIDLNGRTVLELGCGSGLISGFCAQKGAMVTASDINDQAIKELTVLSRDEGWDVIPVYSNLFENLHFHFDYVFINPPIEPKNPMDGLDDGNLAGEDFRFFDTLFSQLKVRTLRDTEVLLYLPEEAELFSICRRAKQHHLKLKTQKIIHKGLNSGTIYRVEEGE
jgi:release factor glutamine methyltransferase